MFGHSYFHEVMKNKSHPNLILFGYKSSGKTYFGKLLAQELECTFIDTDLLVEKQFCETLDCRQICLKIGDEGFRQLEAGVIDSLGKTINAIVAVGGGAVLNPENCEKLKTFGRLVYLEVEREVIRQRIFKSGIPFFLNSDEPDKSFEVMYEERKPIYESVSSFKVSVQGKTDRQVLDELRWLYILE
jgi:shikimate kinase